MLPLCVLLTGCDAEVAHVKEVDDRYDMALDSRHGKTALAYVSKDSIAWFDSMVETARTASKSKVQALPFAERLEVLQIRLLVPAADLKKMDGREYLIRSVDEGWQGSTSQLKRHSVRVNNGRATITYRDPDSGTQSQGYYVLEDGAWKEDRLSLNADLNQSAGSEAREAGMTEDELIFEILGELSGDTVSESVWNPPK